MLNLYPRPTASTGDGDDNGDGYRAFFGIAVACVSLFLFCALAVSVGVWKAAAFTAMAALLLSFVGCFAPNMWYHGRGRPASAVLALAAARRRTRAPGCARAIIDAPPEFAYVCPLDTVKGKQATASCVMCSVCLEDVHGGEMVRQVPACRHIFHVECIDMWLQSHRTCPMCRCVVSPPPESKTKPTALAEAPVSMDEVELLPPV